MPWPRPLILASSSPARRELLRKYGFSFEVIPPHIEEPDGAGVSDVRQYVAELAWRKAYAVARRVDYGVVLAADSVGWHDGEVIGKPTDRQHARQILQRLSGTQHELWTGVCIWFRPEDWQFAWQERSRLLMRPLTEEELEGYLDSGQWQGKSGAYAIQEQDDPFLTVLEGTISNVIGLPMETLCRIWHQCLPVLAQRAGSCQSTATD
ncbi:Septum formation protein Maf [bacterium HR36]|uniref:Nucleoside triphosphate pyrophosphatase n=1 Tax=uncultured Planctomycetota bacterium TaxID=120965 RepID=H5SC07_9BACT|nr:maf protein [uncultured Planctomycetota bacterium]GBD37032.1 Septum formation protein Maf [bacterium HR36]